MLSMWTRMQKRFSSDDRASDECLSHQSVRAIGTTTFSMKKPFGSKRLKQASRLLAQIGDSLGACSSEQDRVRLLSVLAHNGFSVHDDDSSDTSECGGRDNQLMASSEDESSSDSDVERPLIQGHMAHVDPPNMAKKFAVSDLTTPCDPHTPHPTLNNITPPITNVQHLVTPKEQNGNSPSDPAATKPPIVEDKMEWVFTLYDFDGKGSLTKEDIGSLARSIYDVLGNAKVPLQSKCGTTRSGQAIGAFRVKLTVVAESAEITTEQTPQATTNDLQKSTNMNTKKDNDPETPTSASMKHSVAYATIGNRRESKSRRKVTVADQPRQPQEAAFRRRPGIRSSPAPWHYPSQRCACNTHQDYVNLSELENCCTKHYAHSGAHPVRHCEQHCNCADRQPVRSTPRCFACSSQRNCCATTALKPQPPAGHHPFQRTSSARHERSVPRPRSPSSTAGHVIGGSPCAPHERKHRERDKQHDRSMRLVRQWLLDAASTIDEDPCVLPLRRSFVEHRHVHEHHHYIHHADV